MLKKSDIAKRRKRSAHYKLNRKHTMLPKSNITGRLRLTQIYCSLLSRSGRMAACSCPTFSGSDAFLMRRKRRRGAYVSLLVRQLPPVAFCRVGLTEERECQRCSKARRQLDNLSVEKKQRWAMSAYLRRY